MKTIQSWLTSTEQVPFIIASTDETIFYDISSRTVGEMSTQVNRIEALRPFPEDFQSLDVNLSSDEISLCTTIIVKGINKDMFYLLHVSPRSIVGREEMRGRSIFADAYSYKDQAFNDLSRTYANSSEFPRLCLEPQDTVDIIVIGKEVTNLMRERIKHKIGCEVANIQSLPLPEDLHIYDEGIEKKAFLVDKKGNFSNGKISNPRITYEVSYSVATDSIFLVGKNQQGNDIGYQCQRAFDLLATNQPLALEHKDLAGEQRVKAKLHAERNISLSLLYTTAVVNFMKYMEETSAEQTSSMTP
ncbi:hypothetical protein [Legionella quateirensis]|uniref:Uncharacterized protein n=1 Tax=Legionella quateirensis TaxID=45072 RepID=A0A378KUY2_9GAMM|nr:hypothetical protein [Legionella quateirensis]KTD53042.1 hypothetical protein Lqua_0875 [Legionella quateirensis]STY17188.1 Uncharacterised protein [Legionella quateirensis]